MRRSRKSNIGPIDLCLSSYLSALILVGLDGETSTLDGSNGPRDKARLTAKTLVKAAAVPQFRRAIASQMAA